MISETRMIVYMVALAALDLAGLVCILRWIWLDARANGINPWPWILLTGLLSPNFIGLVVYAFVRQSHLREAGGGLCRSCNMPLPTGAKFCPACGTAAVSDQIRTRRLPSKGLLAFGISLMLVATIAILLTIAMGVSYEMGL